MPSPEAWLRGAIEDAAGCPVYPVQAPEGAYPPYVTYMRGGTERARGLDGTSSPVGDFSIEIWCDSYADGKTRADGVRQALVNFSGTESGCTINDVKLTDEKDGDAVYVESRDIQTSVIEQNYSIYWQE
jgi:hypothetical protein